VIAVCLPPLKAQAAWYAPFEYGLFIDGFESLIGVGGPAGLASDSLSSSTLPSSPVKTSIPEIER
jgi:hypothetical protein